MKKSHLALLAAARLSRFRELLPRVAQDLERLASTNKSPEWQRPLQARAMRIRARLHEG